MSIPKYPLNQVLIFFSADPDVALGVLTVMKDFRYSSCAVVKMDYQVLMR
jgi:hypothetical protein